MRTMSRPILYLIAAILAAPWLVPINRMIVQAINELGYPGSYTTALAAAILITVLVIKER